jgi:hypothetical protein
MMSCLLDPSPGNRTRDRVRREKLIAADIDALPGFALIGSPELAFAGFDRMNLKKFASQCAMALVPYKL